MDKRGIYRKGSAGHARNINAYRLSMQRFKRWRYPLTVLLALVFVFGAAPIVGEQMQTSLLTAQERIQLQKAPAEDVRKVLLNSIKSFVDECEKFKITQCVENGKALIRDVIHSGNGVYGMVSEAENFEARFSSAVANAACKYELGGILAQINSSQSSLKTFLDAYGEDLGADSLASFGKLKEVSAALNKVVKSCEQR